MKFFRKPLKPAAHDLIDWNIEDPTGIQIKKDYYLVFVPNLLLN
jgi:hypothetical protein